MRCYIHIPFCNNKCSYCNFASFGITNKQKINKYFEFILNEINNPTFNIKKVGFNSIYFGGGTPTSLSNEQLKTILENLKNKYGFKKDIEITLETNPINITKENLIHWRNIGINRISIGVQTLNKKSLNEIGRGNKGNIFETLEVITSPQPSPLEEREYEVINISLDFIIGLPFVGKGEIKKDIEFLLEKYDFIKHISVYMLETSPQPSPLEEREKGIDEIDYLDEYIEIKDFLEEKGFYSYEISNFAKPGYECKHNKGYWEHGEVLAFGLGAHGYINGVRYEHSKTFKGYYNNEIIFEPPQTKEEIFLEKIMFSLRTTGIKKEHFKKLNQKKINYFINNGLLKIENNILKLQNKGILVLDYILSEII